MPEAMVDAAHAFMQQGPAMCTQAAEHLEHLKDVSRMFHIKGGGSFELTQLDTVRHQRTGGRRRQSRLLN